MKKLPIKQIRETTKRLKGERGTWESHWQEIMDYMLPRKNTITDEKSPGQKRSIEVLDNTGMQSLELLAGFLHGVFTNPDAQWFELTTGLTELDRRDDVRRWLQETAKELHNILNNSNFQTEVHEMYIDLCSIGTGVMAIEKDDDTVIRFRTEFIKEVLCEENHLGKIDQIYKTWMWDAPKIVAEYGLDNVSDKVRKAYEDGKPEKFEIILAIYPSTLVPNQETSWKFISQTILPDHDHELRLKGFKEFPYVVPRWTKGTGETYGRSPAMIALPEVKMLNKMEETVIIGASKVVDPPLQAPDDGFVLPLKTFPGGVSYYRAGSEDRIVPVFNDARIDFGFQSTSEKRTKVRQSFYVDQLMLQTNGPQMTATEVLQRTEEQTRLLGPMAGRQRSEFLLPMISRVFSVALEQGVIDVNRIPEIIKQKRKIDVKYSSLIARAQRINEGQNILRTVQAISPFIQMDPTVVDNFNGDRAVKAIAEVYGFPQEIIRSEKEKEQIRQQRAEAQAAAARQQQEMVNAEVTKNQVPVMDAITNMQKVGT